MHMDQNELKKAVGIKSVDFIKSNSIVGLGTGSTIYFMVEELGRRIKAGELQNVQCVSTSIRTWKQAEGLGIEMHHLNDVDHVDLTIDGADQIDENFQGIKGGGAAQTYEKTVAMNSKKYIWIVDKSKMAKKLGSFPLPLEVFAFGSNQLFKRLKNEGLNPQFRVDENGNRILTDMKNFEIDLHLGEIKHPHLLANWLDHQTGIIEHGLFLDMVNTVIVGEDDGPKIIDNIR